MDVRLSPEQEALRDSAAQMVDRLGPGTVARARRRRAVRPSWTRRWPPRAGASSGSPRRRRPRSPRASRSAIVAEELGRGLADSPFLGPTLAAELRRLAGAPAADIAETVAFAGLPLAAVAGRRRGLPDGAVAVDARGATAALLLVPDGRATRLAAVALGPAEVGTDLTRPGAAVGPGPAVAPVEGPDWAVTADDLRRGRPSGSPSPAPTWSGPCAAPSTWPSTTPSAAASSAGPSARSRPSSTCWPMPTC